MIGFIVGLVVGVILTAGGLFLLAWRDLHKLDAAALAKFAGAWV